MSLVECRMSNVFLTLKMTFSIFKVIFMLF